MQYIDNNHPDWTDMWQQLGADNMNDGDQLCINQSQCWEYIGSTQDHHHFRHSCHPRTGSAVYIYIERARAVAGWA